MAKAVASRDAEKAKNTQTIEDAKNAQAAVAQALAVLKDFYAKAAEATSLIQDDANAQADTVSLMQQQAPYKGQDSGGVIGMLEVIESDFAKLESDTSASESESQRAFDKFASD